MGPACGKPSNAGALTIGDARIWRVDVSTALDGQSTGGTP